MIQAAESKKVVKVGRPKDESVVNQLNSSDEQRIYEELDFLSQNESIDTLIVTAQSMKWHERVRSFEMIRRCEDQLHECSD